MGAKRRFPDDLRGYVFGRLKCVELTGRDKAGQRWLCRCECGTAKVIQRCALVSSATKSCGCYHSEVVRALGVSNETHGMTGTPTYDCWTGMNKRCAAEWDSRYGGRGIKVCDRWARFENFLADMGERPEGTSIDRIDVNGNYEPANCKWSTIDEQANNKRTTRYLTHGGVTMSLSQWARTIGLNPGTLRFRLEKGWSIERSLTKIGT